MRSVFKQSEVLILHFVNDLLPAAALFNSIYGPFDDLVVNACNGKVSSI